jgi:hypothetical protein
LNDKVDVAEAKTVAANSRAEEMATEGTDLHEEMVSLRKSHLKTREELEVEKTKNDELGLELLKVWVRAIAWQVALPVCTVCRELGIRRRSST